MDASDIIFELLPDAPQAVVIGPMWRPRLVVSHGTPALGVRFYPGAIMAFLRHSLANLQECVVPLSEFHATDAQRLLDQLLTSSTLSQKIEIVETWLLSQLRRTAPTDSHVTRAIKWIYAERGRPQIKDLARTAGLCERQLSRKFPVWTGYTPKQFVRVMRFQHALETIVHCPTTSDAAVAANHGYADQSHMIHEFAEFGGGPPRALRRAAQDLNDKCPIFSIPTPGTLLYHRAS